LYDIFVTSALDYNTFSEVEIEYLKIKNAIQKFYFYNYLDNSFSGVVIGKLNNCFL